MTTEHERQLARERKRRLHIRDATDARLPRIRRMIANGMTHKEIGEALGLDRSRISAIVRAAVEAKERELAELEAQLQGEAA